MRLGQRPEAIDTRWVFRTYAALACVSGLVLVGWGEIWFGVDLPGQRFAKAALIRIAGAAIVAAGLCAAGFAKVDDPPSRRRGLLWFAAAHAFVWIIAWSQHTAIWASDITDTGVQILWVVVFALFYFWATSEGDRVPGGPMSLFSGAAAGSTERLRSEYEQRIREAARQEERIRLARDLHDSIKQQIFVIQTSAAAAQARFDSDQSGAKEALGQVRGAAREAMTEMQVMLEQMRAAPLENSGLIASLKRQCEALEFRTGARVEFTADRLPASESLAPGAHEAIQRAAQEALANVARHARAASVRVSLDSAAGQVRLRIEDDGAGFDTAQSSRGQGIDNMRARADEFGGRFELASRPGGGVSVAFSVPYAETATAREYGRRALPWSLFLLVSLALMVTHRSVALAIPLLFAVAGVVRYLVAYRRVRMRDGAA